MRDILGGLTQVFWNTDERRFRALLRFVATLGIFLLAASLVESTGVLLGVLFANLGVGIAARTAVVQLFVLALTVGATLGITWAVDRRHLRDLGLAVDSQWWTDLFAGLGIGVVMAVATVGAGVGLGAGSVEGVLTAQGTGQFEGLSPPVGVVLGIGLFALLVFLYELLFRGYLLVNTAEGLFRAVGTSRAVGTGVVASTVLFGLAHAPLPAASLTSGLPVTLFALLLATTVAVTGQLALALGVHTAWALLVGPVFGLPFRGFELSAALVRVEFDGPVVLTGGAFGPEGGLLALVGLALGFVGVAGWFRQQGRTFAAAETIVVPDLWITDE
ncbi:MAG: CPBP family intramembrane glutamic endopeptidase [Halovenus sp.]